MIGERPEGFGKLELNQDELATGISYWADSFVLGSASFVLV
jgi:hypothetical protein